MTSSKKQEVIRDIGGYSAALMLTQCVTVVAALLMRRFLGPVEVGLWTLIQLVLTYAEYANLGVTTAIQREIPYYQGKGDHRRVKSIQNTVFSFSMMASALFSVGLLVYAWVRKQALGPELFCGLLFAPGLVLLQRVNSVLISLVRAFKHFGLAGRQMLLSALVNMVLVSALSYAYKIYGFLLALYLSLLFNIFYILRRKKFSFRYAMKWRDVRGLVSYGFPLLLLTLLGTLFETIDRMVIMKYLGFRAMGWYSIAIMIYAYIYSIPNAVSIVVIPNLHEKFGETNDKRSLKGYVGESASVYSTLMALLIGAGFFVAPVLVRWVLPEFVPGIGAMRYYILGAFFVGIAQGYSQFIYVIKKHLVLLPIVGFSCLVAVALNLAAIRQGWGIEGVALATTTAMGCNFLVTYVYAAGHLFTAREALGQFMVLLAKFLYMLAFLYGIDAFVRIVPDALNALLKLLLYAAVYGPFIWKMDRDYHLFSMLKRKYFAK